MRAGLALGAWLVLAVAGLLALHGLGRAFPAEAILGNDLELALAAALRLVGLAAGYWLVASTVAYLVAVMSGAARALRVVRWATFPPMRRLADLVAARTLVAALAFPAPLASAVDPGYLPVPAGDPPPPQSTTSSAPNTTAGPDTFPSATSLPPTTNAPAVSDPRPEKQASPPVPPRAEPAMSLAAMEVVVQPGDNMWDLAAARLAVVLGRDPTSREIVPYWTRMIEENQSRIRSGDPDLIFPGELLVLPPL